MRSNISVLLIFSLLLIKGHEACSQEPCPFELGRKQYYENNYSTAISYFTELVSNKYMYEGKLVPQAYYYRAKSIVKQYNIAISNNDAKFVAEFPDLLLHAFEDLEQAIIFDNGKHSLVIEETKKDLLNVGIRFGVWITDSLHQDYPDAEHTDSLITLVVNEMKHINNIYNDSLYLVKDLMGVLEYKTKNYDVALRHFEESEILFQKNESRIMDLKHVYNYYYSCLIQYQEKKDFDKALELVRKAKKYATSCVAILGAANSEKLLNISDLEKKLENLEFQIKLLHY